MQQSDVAKLFNQGHDAAASDKASDSTPPRPASSEPGAPDDHPITRAEIVTQSPAAKTAAAEIVASNSESNPNLRTGQELETVWEDTLQTLPKPKPHLHRLLPTTARIGVLGLVAFAMWWTWPRSDDHNAFVNDVRAGDPASLAVVNPANVASNGAAVLAAPAASPDATTLAAQFNDIVIVTPTSVPSATTISTQATDVTTPTLNEPIVLEASTLVTDAANGNIIIRIPEPATSEPLMPSLADEAKAQKASQTELILIPTATPSPTAQAVAALSANSIPKVEIVPAVSANNTPTAVSPTPTAVATDIPSPTPPPRGPGRLWSTFTPLPAAEIDHFWFNSPFAGVASANIYSSPSYQFGSTGGDRYRIHHGLDFSNPSGTPVKAGVEGTVVHAGPDTPELLGPYNNFYGNAVVILLDKQLPVAGGKLNVYLLYGHLSEVKTEVGQHVEPTDLVGLVGMTGIAIGPHLHVEARLGTDTYDHSIDPYLWLKPQPGYGAVAVRVLTANGRTWAGAKVSIAQFVDGRAVWGRQIDTYLDAENIGPDPVWGENGAMGDVPAGSYSLFANINGEKIRSDFTVNDGATTFVEVRTKQ